MLSDLLFLSLRWSFAKDVGSLHKTLLSLSDYEQINLCSVFWSGWLSQSSYLVFIYNFHSVSDYFFFCLRSFPSVLQKQLRQVYVRLVWFSSCARTRKAKQDKLKLFWQLTDNVRHQIWLKINFWVWRMGLWSSSSWMDEEARTCRLYGVKPLEYMIPLKDLQAEHL